MDDKICIVMATHNGEKYILEQIESIQRQTYQNFELYINDDASTDSTLEFLKSIETKDSRIHVASNKRGGACANFCKLIEEHRNAAYLMLCDQDDVWSDNKIEETLKAMKGAEERFEIVLVYCEKLMVDENLVTLPFEERCAPDTLHSLLCHNHIYGCTMMVNNKLIDEALPFPENLSMHDYWLALTAASKGDIVKIAKPLIKYRQHSNNVTGGLNQYGLRNKIVNWKGVNKKMRADISTCLDFCKKHAVASPVMERYVGIFEARGIRRIFRLLKYGYKLGRPIATFRGFVVVSTMRAGMK